ncbi:putative E3 ubiquitin-protein ligase ATL44 [Wolffia australiana]
MEAPLHRAEDEPISGAPPRRYLLGMGQAWRMMAKEAAAALFIVAFVTFVPLAIAAGGFLAVVAASKGLRRLAGGPPGGLTEIEIEEIDSFVFKAGEEEREGDCAVCLAEFEDGEVIRRLGCGHCYHGECVGRWLRHRARCPKCAGEVKVQVRGGRVRRLRVASARVFRRWFGA